jgi:hypothetical protein
MSERHLTSNELSTRVAELRHLRNLLKTGEYMGTDIMLAWIALAEYADLLEAGNSASEPRADGIAMAPYPFELENPLPDEKRAATSRGAHSTEDAGRPGPSSAVTKGTEHE